MIEGAPYVGGLLSPYPFVQAAHYNAGHRDAIDLIVIHTMETDLNFHAARRVAEWFAGATAPQASAHYCIDADEVIQCVLETDLAWHAGAANPRSIGIEHAGWARFGVLEWGSLDAVSMLALSAQLVAELCDRYSIPVVHCTKETIKAGHARGICGHWDVSQAFGGTHWDPGPAFPWSSYLDSVSASCSSSSRVGTAAAPSTTDGSTQP